MTPKTTSTETTSRLVGDQLLFQAFDACGLGVWDLDLVTGDCRYSSSWKATLGYADHEIANRIEEWERLTEPEDLAAFYAEAQRRQVGEAVRQELRMRAKDGSIKSIATTGCIVDRTADGRPRRIVGTATDATESLGADDLTEWKRQEEVLLEKTALLARAHEVADIGTYMINLQSRTIALSAELAGLYAAGSEPFELTLDEYRRRFFDADDRQRTAVAADAAYRSGEAFSNESRIVRDDGEVIWIHARSAPSRGQDGASVVIGVVQDITERKQAELEREQARRRLQGLFDTTTIGMAVVTPSGEPVTCNDALAAMLGYTADELVGINFTAFTHAADLERELPLFGRIQAGRIDNYQIEKSYIRKDGTLLPVRLWLSAVRYAESGDVENYVALVEDLTESKRTLEELREKAAALARAQEIGRIGSFYSDLRAGTATWSAELARLFGFGTDGFESDQYFWRSLIHPDDREAVGKTMDRAYLEGSAIATEFRFCRPDGRVMWARMHAEVERDEAGEPMRIVGVVQDIDEQHELEQRMRQGQRLEAVGQLAGGIAHDFNNLLTVIGGNVEMALAEVHDPGVKRDLEEVLRSAERAADLVRQLLAFSCADTVEVRSVDVNEAVERVRRMLERLLRENIEMQTDLAPDRPSILADPGQLEQVLLNLAVNARDAMPNGGVLSIQTWADTDTVRLEVSDTGTGMDEHTRERIFNPFFTTKALGEGTGLGLSSVYGIVKNVGGEIAVESRSGSGTTFTLSFPRVAEDARARPSVAAGHVRGSGERILLVEDEELVRAVTAELLSRAGYTVVTANDGEDALRLLEEEERPFDLVFTDLMMPRMTGTELAARLRERGYDLPIVFSSGYAQNVLAGEQSDARAVVLSKPFTGEALGLAVHGLLARARGSADL